MKRRKRCQNRGKDLAEGYTRRHEQVCKRQDKRLMGRETPQKSDRASIQGDEDVARNA